MTSTAAQVGLLLRKNLAMRVRRPVLTFLKVVLPAVFLFVFVIGSVLDPPDRSNRPAVPFPPAGPALPLGTYSWSPVYPPFGPYSFDRQPYAWASQPPQLLYSLASDDVDPRAVAVAEIVAARGGMELVHVPDAGDIDGVVARNRDGIFGAIVFESLTEVEIQLNATFSARTGSKQIFEAESVSGPESEDYFLYYQNGFLALQHALHNATLGVLCNETLSVSEYRPFPTPRLPPLPEESFTKLFNAIFINLGTVYFLGMSASAIVYEHSSKTKQAMRGMGLRESAYWTSHFVTLGVESIFASWFFVGALRLANIFVNTDVGVVYLFVQLYFLQIVALSMLMGTRIKAPDQATGLAFAGLVIPTLILVGVAPDNFSVLEIMALVPPWAPFALTKAIVDFETSFASLGADDMATVYGMQTISVLVLVFFTWQMSDRPRSSFGSRQRVDNNSAGEIAGLVNSDGEEGEPPSGPVAVTVRGLTKVFRISGKETLTAVNRLNLDLCRGQVTALLGANGGGKTTTIGLLTGLLTPDGGQARFGVDKGGDIVVPGGIEELRPQLGICPQHDILFEGLSGREHLALFAELKGVPREQIASEVDKMLEKLDLVNSAEREAMTYSGGMKRRISLGMALLGDPQYIFLDEVTTGMDPRSRSFIWQLIADLKKDKVVVLTTHFMDEAELLGDRIVILKKGQLQVAGSSLFLKRKFDVGYTLDVGEDQWRQRILSKIEGAHEDEGQILLPVEASSQFPDLFEELDEKGAPYSLALRSLEDVFLRVHAADDEEEDEGKDAEEGEDGGGDDVEEEVLSEEQIEVELPSDIKGSPPSTGTVLATLMDIRRRSDFRTPEVYGFALVMPMIWMIVALSIASGVTESFSRPGTLELNLGEIFAGSGVFVTERVNGSLAAALDMATDDDVVVFPDWDAAYERNLDDAETLVAGFDVDEAGSWAIAINSTVVPSAPLAIDLLGNVVGGRCGAPEFRTFSAPFEEDTSDTVVVDLLLPMFFGLAFIAVSPNAAFVIMQMRLKKLTQQLLIYGVTPLQYWGGMFAFDVSFLVPHVVMSIVLVSAFDTEQFGGARLVALPLIVISYGMSSVPLLYLLTRLFPTFEVATQLLPTAYNVLGVVPQVLVFVLEEEDEDAKPLADALSILFPPYAIMRGLTALTTMSKDVGDDIGQVFAWHRRVSFVIFFNLVNMAVYTVLLWWVEVRDPKAAGAALADDDEEAAAGAGARDQDIQDEIQRIEQGGPGLDKGLVVEHVTKSFGGFVAVKDLTFGVEHGELFVLLGRNGAGKTTICSIITGDLRASRGRAVVGGETDKLARAAKLGFCPQFSALFEKLTVLEHTEIFGRLKGLNKEQIKRVSDILLKQLSLEPHAKNYAGKLSGGNQRKLSVALSLLANPDVVLLDEPSSGMDPKSRRLLWGALQQAVRGRAMLMSTHSMEEAEALATKIGIMAHGELVCVGAPAHLQERFGGDLIVEAHGTGDLAGTLITSLREATGAPVRVQDHVGDMIKAEVQKVSLAKAFRAMENSIPQEAGLTYYSITPSSMTQIFLKFAGKN